MNVMLGRMRTVSDDEKLLDYERTSCLPAKSLATLIKIKSTKQPYSISLFDQFYFSFFDHV